MKAQINKIRLLLGSGKKMAAFWLVVLMVVGSLFEVVGIASIPAFISLLESPDLVSKYSALAFLHEATGAETHEQFLLFAAIGLIGIFVVKNTYLALLSMYRAHFIFTTQHEIGVRVFGAYLQRPYTFHLQHNSAELLRNVKENSSIVVNAFLFSVVKILMESLNVVFIFILLVVVEPVVSLVAMGVLGAVSGGFLMLIRKKTVQYGEDEQEQHQNMIKAVTQGLGGLKESIVLGRQQYFLDAFAHSSKRYSIACKFKRVMEEMPQRIIETIAVTGMLLIAVVFLARGGDMMVVIPLLALFGTAAVKLMPSMKALVSSLHTITYYGFAVDNVCNELRAIGHQQISLPAASWDAEKVPFKGDIQLKDITFAYPEAKNDALKQVCLQIKRGQAVAFVGSSGAGKTTLVDLLLGILKPTSGQINVDGKDVHNDLRKWQSRLGYIPQQIYLSDTTIANNIAFGVPTERVSLNRVVEVSRIAQLDDFVQSLPDGYETVIGESGVRLSGGQRQRIGIARALYHAPDVLVMDEATSALDNKTERFFMEALQQLRDRYTIIMIAHRLSTVKECDELFMMENGKVTARGTYDELMAGSEAFQDIATVH